MGPGKCTGVSPGLRLLIRSSLSSDAFSPLNQNAHQHGEPSRRVSCILQTSCLPRSRDNNIITARDNHVQQTIVLGCGGRCGSPCRGHRNQTIRCRSSEVGSWSQVSFKSLVDVSLFNPIPELYRPASYLRTERAYRFPLRGSSQAVDLRSQVF